MKWIKRRRANGVMGSSEELTFEAPSRPARAYAAWRLFMIAFAAVLVLGLFGARLYYLTVLRHPHFLDLSENNYLFERPIDAPRGRIVLTDGTPVGLNAKYYNIEMSPFSMKGEAIVQTVRRVAEITGRPEIEEKARAVIDQRPRWARVTLVDYLDFEAAAPVLERLFELPGVMIETHYYRYYPEGRLFGHVTGYTGPIFKKQLTRYMEKGYLRNDRIGKQGLEYAHEDELRGEKGVELLIRDAYGRARESRIEKRALAGSDIVLTIDLRLQLLCDEILTGQSGVAIVMDPRDGSILAMAAKPDYDPNHPTRNISGVPTSSYNKATRGAYAPGSLFKLVTASAGLLSGVNPSSRIYCGGVFAFHDIDYHCHYLPGHGRLNLWEAIQHSCNVFFYTTANNAGRARMLETAHGFGFFQRTGIDLYPEPSGDHKQDRIYSAMIVQMGIGQGAICSRITPLQMLNAYCALANGGALYRPHVIKERRTARGEVIAHEPDVAGRLPLTPEQIGILKEGFRRVIQEPGGTAANKNFDPAWNASGKTGTAQVTGQTEANAWFVAYAPSDRPEVAILVLIENAGQGSTVAAPLARRIMAAYFEKPAPGPSTTIASGDAASAIPVPPPPPPPDPEAAPSWEIEDVPFWARRN